MNYKQEKALNIACQIVVAKMSNNTETADKITGNATGEFFKAVYDGVLEIISSTAE